MRFRVRRNSVARIGVTGFLRVRRLEGSSDKLRPACLGWLPNTELRDGGLRRLRAGKISALGHSTCLQREGMIIVEKAYQIECTAKVFTPR